MFHEHLRRKCILLFLDGISYKYPLNPSFFKFYLFLAALGLHRCTQAFSSSGERGLLFVAVRGLLIAVASLAVEHGL